MTNEQNKGIKETSENVGFNNASEVFDLILETAKTKSSGETSSSVASPEEINVVVSHILKMKKLTTTQENYNRVLATIAHLVQIGATSPKFAMSRMVTDYGIELKAGDLRDACSKHEITPRKLARGIKDYVIKVSSKFNLEGNLAKSYKLENPTCDKQDLIWVSDFQTFSENTSMPEHVRTWLLENYRNRFRPN